MYSERKIHRNFHYQPINLGKILICDKFLHKSEILRVNASNKTEMITSPLSNYFKIFKIRHSISVQSILKHFSN
jgi:hypothetical protein